MATIDSDTQNLPESSATKPKNTPVDSLTDTLQKTTLEQQPNLTNDTNGKAPETPPRKLYVYTRSQLLHLSKSSLVKTPSELPSFRDWFGDWHEQQASNKKEVDPGTPSNQRDRRFRRDPDDADAPQRPSFRSTLSQPSQMGNFRHQSIRTTERDRDRDGDRERDRDKEGQERLRNLSDKYDRDRLALAGSALRNKDRDSAPHLASTMRLGSSQSTTTSRRVEGRDAPRRKLGEASDDWRRGDPSRSGRDDRAENGRRENRERARSKSRSRRDPSSTRRDRDRDDREKDRDRRDDRDDRRRGERDDYSRRERDDHYRRDNDDHYVPDRDDFHRDSRDRREYDRDRDAEDDPRRWRDDGKRDERMAARRERERDRGWDRWEPSHDRNDDRDGRTRRNGGRERRDDAKERDDRREKEKEKEPAWMDDYVPTTPGGGILGGQGADGGLDGIQAWKKGMKEKERKEKEAGLESQADPKVATETTASTTTEVATSAPLDEMFKLLIKKEAEKGGSRSTEPLTPDLAPKAEQNGSSKSLEDSYSGPPTATLINPQPPKLKPQVSTDSQPSPLPTNEPARSLLSLISTDVEASAKASIAVVDKSDMPTPPVSRLFGNVQPISTQVSESQTSSANASPVFNPPPGSRLLAFGSRAPPSVVGGVNGPKSIVALEAALHSGNPLANPSLPTLQKLPGPSAQVGNVGLLSNHDLAFNEVNLVSNPRATPSDTGRSTRSFSPFNQHQPGVQYSYEEIQELNALGRAPEHLRRTSVTSSLERPYPIGSDGGSPYSDMNSPASNFPVNGPPYDLGGLAGANYAAVKGSRFAKFFDGKTREQPQGVPTVRKGPGFGPSISPLPGQQRPDPLMASGLLVNGPEGRTMDDIVAMLQNSTQGHRASPQLIQQGRLPPGGGQFNQNVVDIHTLHLQQLQQQQQQQQYNQRLESLYDSRLDDRNFVPDGMVPGLRPAPRPRSRGPSGALYNDILEEQLHFTQQRLPPQHRNIEQMYAGPGNFITNVGRGAPIPLQQQQFRGNPSPSQNSIPGSSQRLPPGLANLGGRPPHDPSQYINPPMGLPGGGMTSNPPAQNFNNFNGGGPGFGGNVPGRGPMAAPHHQNQIPLNHLAGLNPGVDIRGVNQAQLLGMGGAGLGGGVGLGGNIRGGGGFNPQHGPAGQIPPMGMRQPPQPPQQQHAPPHIMQQMLPHLQQQHGMGASNSQEARDIMALLMGGGIPRE